jgi:DnaJ homolog subfamily C member 28
VKDIEDQIRRAMESGQFDNLPGKGKPLRLEKNPFEPEDWRMAHHLLRSNGFTLPWIEVRREIEIELEAARSSLERTRRWRLNAEERCLTSNQAEAEWQRAMQGFHLQIATLNRKIFDFNLHAPGLQFQMPRLDEARELAEIIRLTTLRPSDTL